MDAVIPEDDHPAIPGDHLIILIIKCNLDMKRFLTLMAALLLFTSFTFSQYKTKYPDIPRIDVHSHPHYITEDVPVLSINPDYTAIENYLSLRTVMLKESGADLAMWVSLGGDRGIDTVTKISKNRVITCISDYAPQRGLSYKPEDIAGFVKKGYAGYKMWFAPYERRLKEGEKGVKYFDEEANEAVLAAMEKAGMPGASIHIADPNGAFGNRGEWCADPVAYWRMIVGLERVLQRHPKLTIVAAHGAWLVCQDAQIDFLRYLFSTYPNFYVDLAATDQYYHLVSYDNLRDLFMEYSDRILFGTDSGRLKESGIENSAKRYNLSFEILETANDVPGSFFGDDTTKGLNLPREVLEKIYYKNALKVYPLLSERMKLMGYIK